MFKLIGFLIRLSFFTIIVLVLGNTVKWKGRTISDQIRLKISHAERLLQNPKGHFKLEEESRRFIDKIPPSERQKLKDLIRELNSEAPKK